MGMLAQLKFRWSSDAGLICNKACAGLNRNLRGKKIGLFMQRECEKCLDDSSHDSSSD